MYYSCMKKIFISLTMLLFIFACAKPYVVETRQYGDADKSCSQLDSEIYRTEQVIRDAKEERGMTGTNVAAVLFWLPGLAATYMNVNEAVEAGEERLDVLYNLKAKKNC